MSKDKHKKIARANASRSVSVIRECAVAATPATEVFLEQDDQGPVSEVDEVIYRDREGKIVEDEKYRQVGEDYLASLVLKTEQDAYLRGRRAVVLPAFSSFRLSHEAGVRAVEAQRAKSERDAKAKRDKRAAKKQVG